MWNYVVEFDYLVMMLGSVMDMICVLGMIDYVWFMKNVVDVLWLWVVIINWLEEVNLVEEVELW